jgi:outer membrane beta-barrel protein
MGSGQALGRALVLTAFALGTGSAVAHAQPAAGSPSAPGPDSPAAAASAGTGGGTSAAVPAAPRPSDQPVPSCLDQSIVDQLGRTLRPRGVQKRDFLKRGQLEIVAHGGLFAGDLLSSSYDLGGAVAWFPTEDLGIEARADLTYVKLDLDKPLADFTGNDRFEAGHGVVALAGLLWSPIHAKMKIGGGITHADVLLAAGGGRLINDTAQGLAFDGGVIMDLFVSHWVTLRFDLRDLVLVQEAVAETRVTNNIMATGGIGLWLPTGW